MCCGCWGKLRRLVWRVFKWTLPFTVLPALLAIVESVFFWKLVLDMQIKAADELEQFTGLAGFPAPTSHLESQLVPPDSDIPRAPYYVPDLTNPTRWWRKLGLDRFDINHIEFPTVGFEQPMDLSEVSRLFRHLDPDELLDPNIKEWHHWIYISPSSHLEPANTPSPWDEAFDALIQHHYAHPAAHNASFSFLPCADAFLCTLWAPRAPAFIHLTTSIAPERPRTPAEARLVKQVRFKPIDMRIVRLGHKSTPIALLPTPKDKLLGPLEQMLALTGTENAFRLLPGYSEGAALGELLAEDLIRRRRESLWYLCLQLVVTLGAYWPASLIDLEGLPHLVKGIVFPVAMGFTSVLGPMVTSHARNPWKRFVDPEAARVWQKWREEREAEKSLEKLREKKRETQRREMQARRLASRAEKRRQGNGDEPRKQGKKATRRVVSREASASQV